MVRPALPILALTLTASLLGITPMVVGHVHRDGSGAPALFTSADIQWKDGPPSLPPGAKFAVLEGDAAKEGPFTMRFLFPNGYRIPPHHHPKTERVTVISGSLQLGMGEKFDEKALRVLPAGTYGFLPVGMRHFAQSQGDTVIQLHGTGPWEIIYVNPSDDPRRAIR